MSDEPLISRPWPGQTVRRLHRRRRHRRARCGAVRRSASSGPNGAGKCSTMRMIGCVSPPTGGRAAHPRAWIRCATARRIRARLGVCPQLDNLDLELTVRENLTTYARYFGIPRKVARRARRRAARLRAAHRAGRQQGRAAVRRHEAPAHHRPGAGQRAGDGAARRADHRASTRRPGTWCGSGCSGSSSRASRWC